MIEATDFVRPSASRFMVSGPLLGARAGRTFFPTPARGYHRIYKTGELKEVATCAKIAQVQNVGGRQITRVLPFYDLDLDRSERRAHGS